MGYADNEHKTAGIHMRSLGVGGCSTESRVCRASGCSYRVWDLGVSENRGL